MIRGRLTTVFMTNMVALASVVSRVVLRKFCRWLFMAIFSERVKELRKSKGLTQRQMAAALGITERSYQRYEAENNPNNDTLIKLADFFNVSTDYLLGRSDCKAPPHAKNRIHKQMVLLSMCIDSR